MNEVIAAKAPGFRPKVAVVLGSGLGGFAEEVKPESRLSCQIRVTDALDGLVVRMPENQH